MFSFLVKLQRRLTGFFASSNISKHTAMSKGFTKSPAVAYFHKAELGWCCQQFMNFLLI
jgi:hypothetical protein